jgi:ATPase subunit of ABC transporter with duplicated ATPase domains
MNMPLVTVSQLNMHYGGPDLLRGVSLDVDPGAKIGLIGQNGTGKSTLLKIIAGEVEPTDGQVFRQKNLKLAYQAQELKAPPGATAISEMRLSSPRTSPASSACTGLKSAWPAAKTCWLSTSACSTSTNPRAGTT